MRIPFATGILILGGAAVLGQTFDVASVKRSAPYPPGPRVYVRARGGPGTANPGQITSSHATLRGLLITAYDVQSYQISGPAWIETERYDVTAKVPAGATREQVRIMWQHLLAERFGVVMHHELRKFQVEELVVAEGGHKLKESEIDPNVPPAQAPAGRTRVDKNGFPELDGPGMIHLINKTPHGPIAHTVAKAQPTSQLAIMLGNQLRQPVIDRTGLTGKYDFTLEFTPDMKGIPILPQPPEAAFPGSVSAPRSNLPTAIQQQLGLRLVANSATLDVIVVDYANKTPAEN